MICLIIRHIHIVKYTSQIQLWCFMSSTFLNMTIIPFLDVQIALCKIWHIPIDNLLRRNELSKFGFFETLFPHLPHSSMMIAFFPKDLLSYTHNWILRGRSARTFARLLPQRWILHQLFTESKKHKLHPQKFVEQNLKSWKFAKMIWKDKFRRWRQIDSLIIRLHCIM